MKRRKNRFAEIDRKRSAKRNEKERRAWFQRYIERALLESTGPALVYLLLVAFLVGFTVGAIVFYKPRLIIGVPVEKPVPSRYPHVGGIRI